MTGREKRMKLVTRFKKGKNKNNCTSPSIIRKQYRTNDTIDFKEVKKSKN